MVNQRLILGTLTGLVIFSLMTLGGQAATMSSEHFNSRLQFRRIEQPLALKAVVTLGGLGLISLELWWFLFSQTKKEKG